MSVNVEWLLKGEPRAVQVEALTRSLQGYAIRDRFDEDGDRARPLPHAGRVASGWGHLMEMRLGKTPVLLNEFAVLRRAGLVDRMLVLSTPSFVATWAKEAQTFEVDAEVHLWQTGKPDEARTFWVKNPRGIVVMNYEALVYRAAWLRIAEFVDDRCLVGADESVKLKNPTTSFFKSGKLLTQKAIYKRILSGLYVPRAPFDAWSQYRFIDKLDGVNFHAFKHRYTKMGGFRGKQPQGFKSPEAEERFKELADNFAFRARRKDWNVFQGVDYETIELTLINELVKPYQEMERDYVTYLCSGEEISAVHAAAKYMKLQQIASGFVYDENKDAHWLVPINKTTKFRELKALLDGRAVGKVLVFVHLKPTLWALFEELKEYNPALIVGKQDQNKYGVNLENEKDRFNKDPACRVLIAQAEAGKYGHTLMGNPSDPCLNVVFYENNFNLDTRRQCEERPQGSGQVANLVVTDYVSSAIERHVIDALQKRLDVAKAAMSAALK